MRINKQVYILLSCWFLVNGFLFYSLGIKYAIDTTRFDLEASAWLNGTFEPSYRLWYSGYIALLTLCKIVFDSIYPSIFLQYVFSALGTLYFYKGLQKLFKNRNTAFYSTLLVICYFPIQQWNTCLLTDSLFISMILFFVWALSLENNTRKWVILFFISGLTTCLRPNGGILLITCCGMYGLQKMPINKLVVILFLVPLAIGLFILQNFTDVFYQFLLDSFNKGEVVCGYANSTIQPTFISNDSSRGSITKIAHLLIEHPKKSTHLFVIRFFTLWSDVRAYYSSVHNIFISAYLLLSYSMAAIGFIKYRKVYTELVWLTLFYCGLNSLLVILTYADWDGRFLAPLLPIAFIWAGLGMHAFIGRVKLSFIRK